MNRIKKMFFQKKDGLICSVPSSLLPGLKAKKLVSLVLLQKMVSADIVRHPMVVNMLTGANQEY